MRQQRWHFVPLSVLILLCCALPLTAVTVLPGQGVSFNQVDFTFTEATLLNSSTGEIFVDVATLKAQAGLSSGYINVATSLGWVVQNLPIFPGYPYPSISTNFNLGSTAGVDVTSLQAFVDFQPSPSVSFPGGPPTSFPVGNVTFGAEGVGGNVTSIPPPPPPGVVTFQPGGLIDAKFQPDHPTLQTANNQCLPAALASSLQWLQDTYHITVPHPNNLGLGTDANNDGKADDGTLVGQLDIETRRAFESRTRGCGLSVEDGLHGKLRYIGKNGLADKLVVKHMGTLGGGNVSETVVVPGGNNVTVISTGLGDPVTAAALSQEISDGEDVELCFAYKGLGNEDNGGHAVEVVGVGRILGVPWIAHQSDYKQSNVDDATTGDGIPDNEGTDRIDFTFLADTDGDGRLNLIYNKLNANIVSFFSQSPGEVDHFPSTSAVFDLIGPSTTERIRMTGPSTVNVAIGPHGEATDSDGNGRDQVRTEMVQLDLTGSSPSLGPISLKLRDFTKDPFQRTSGEIEEASNTMTGRLDVPPFAPTGTATSYFNVYFEVTVNSPGGPVVLHNRDPKLMTGTIHHKPPATGDLYQPPPMLPVPPIPLYTEDNQPSPYSIGPARHVPNPESDPPTCAVKAVYGVGANVTIQDTGTGLATIEVTQQQNATVNVPNFPLGDQDPVLVTASKQTPGMPSEVELRITDVSGNVTFCDPVLTLQVRDSGKPVDETLNGLSATEHLVTIANGNPGLKSLRVTVNGQQLMVAGLKDGETRTLDVSSAMHPGNGNVIVLTPQGKPGGSAEVAIHD
jgi:hypothetical protein